MGGFSLERLEQERERVRSRQRATPSRATGTVAKATGKPIVWSGSSGDGDGGGGKSLLGQVGSVVSAVPGGLAQLGAQTWDSTVGTVGGAAQNVLLRQNADEIRSRKGPLGAVSRAFANESMLESISEGRGFRDNLESALPLFDAVGASVTDTVGRVTDQTAALAPGGKAAGDGAYAQASKDSNILAVLLEDIGNVALGGAAVSQPIAGAGRAAAAARGQGAMAGRPLRAALTSRQNLPTAGRAAQAADRVATVGRRVDEGLGQLLTSPVRIPSTLSRLATGEGMSPLGRYRTGKGLGEVVLASPRGRALRESAAGRFFDSRGLSKRSREGYTPLAEGPNRRLGQDAGVVAEAVQRVVEIADDPVVQIASRLRTSGMADALADGLARLDPASRTDAVRRLVEESGLLEDGLSRLDEVDGPATYAAALDLATRSLSDPGSIPAAQLRTLEAATEAWQPVTDTLTGQFADQWGELTKRDPGYVDLLAGKPDPVTGRVAALPHERARVFSDFAPKVRKARAKVDEAIEKRDRAAGRLRFDEDFLRSGGKGNAERTARIDELARKLIEVEGLEPLGRLLFPDEMIRVADDGTLITLDGKQAERRIRNELHRQINGRALMLEAGEVLPPDVISTFVQSNSIAPAVLPSRAGMSTVTREAGKEAVGAQAARDVDRLGRKLESAEAAAEGLSTAIENAIRNVPVRKGMGKLRAALRRELRADADVKAAATAYTKLRNALRDRVLSDAELETLIRESRRAALPILKTVVRENAGRIQQWFEGPFNLSKADNPEWVERFVRQMQEKTGLSRDQWSKMRLPNKGSRFVDPKSPIVFDNLPAYMEDSHPTITRNSSVEDAIDAATDDLARYINAQEMQGWIDGRKRSKKQKLTKKQRDAGMVAEVERWREGGLREYLKIDPESGAARMVEDVIVNMSDPRLAYAVFDPDALTAVREIQSEYFDEGFSSVPDDAALAVVEAYRDAEAMASSIETLTDADVDAALAVSREDFVHGYDGAEAAARGKAFDEAVARSRRGMRQGETANAVRNMTRQMFRSAGGQIGQAGRTLGRAEGRVEALGGELRAAQRRTGTNADDLDGAVLGAAAQAGESVARKLAPEIRKLEVVKQFDREVTRATRKLAKVEADMAAELAAAAERVRSAPARYRLSLQAGRAMGSVVDDMTAAGLDATVARSVQAELITTVTDALDRLDPDQTPGGRLPGSTGSAVRAPAFSKTKSSYVKEGDVPSLTPTDQGVLIIREMQKLARNELVREIMGRHGKTGAELVPDLVDPNTGLGTVAGAKLIEAVNAASDVEMIPWNPRSPFQQVEQASVSTTFIPRWVADAFEYEHGKAGTVERMLQTLVDTPTRLWKHDVLALSPRWQLGNMVGNFLVAWAGGVSPAEQLALARQAWRTTRDQGVADPRLAGSGLVAEVTSSLAFGRALGDETTPPTRAALREFRNPNNRAQRAILSRLDGENLSKPYRAAAAVTHPIRSSYKLNGFVDDFTHNLVYLDSLKKGMDPEAAIQRSLKVAGDFSNMTKFERSVVRRVLPFYSWLRHITKLSADLAVNHPVRSAWTLHLWTLFASDEDLSDIPGLAGSISLGDNQYIRAANYMPFGTVTDFDLSNPLGTLGASANPYGKLALEAGLGLEFGPGGPRPLTGPPGSGRVDGYGNSVLGPIGLDATAYRAARMFPSLRAANQLRTSGDDRVVRYGTGDPVRLTGRFGKHTIPDENAQGNAEIIFRNRLGLPVPATSDADAIRARRVAKERQRGG